MLHGDVPFACEALKDASNLLAHDLKLGDIRIGVDLLHHLQHNSACKAGSQELHVMHEQLRCMQLIPLCQHNISSLSCVSIQCLASQRRCKPL